MNYGDLEVNFIIYLVGRRKGRGGKGRDVGGEGEEEDSWN